MHKEGIICAGQIPTLFLWVLLVDTILLFDQITAKMFPITTVIDFQLFYIHEVQKH